MNRKTLIALGIVGVLALGGAASDANAVCGNATNFALAFTSNTQYLVFPVDADRNIFNGVLKGRWWQAGARTLHNESPDCPESSYLVNDGSGNATTIYGFMGGDWGQGVCGGTGCPAGTLVLTLQTLSTDGSKAYYVAGKVNQDGVGNFDFGTAAIDWNVVPMPRPRVSSSTRGGTNVTTNLVFDAPSVAARGETNSFPAESIVTGYQLLRFTGTADPGRNPAAWGAPVQTLTTTASGATVTGLVNDCSNPANDVFLATRVVFDGGQFQSDYVSQATRIECDPNLADPRFKLIDKKKPSRGTIQPR